MEKNGEIDMLKVLEQAMALSKTFQNDNKESTQQKTDDNNMEGMLKMAEMFSLINKVTSKQETHKKQKEDTKNTLYTEMFNEETYFETDINTPAIKTIKSALPYLDYKYQKNIGVAIKLIEIQRILDKYSTVAVNMNITKNKNWRKNMILAIRPHMEEEKKQMIDTIIKFMDIKEIVERIKS